MLEFITPVFDTEQNMVVYKRETIFPDSIASVGEDLLRYESAIGDILIDAVTIYYIKEGISYIIHTTESYEEVLKKVIKYENSKESKS